MNGSPRVLLIDNVDSFTFNVADLLHRVLGTAPTVWRHDHSLRGAPRWWCDFDAIVVGPGPGRPSVDADMGISRQALDQHEVPVLGVCLGHQGIAHASGHLVEQMTQPRHGIVSSVTHGGTGLFAGVPSPFDVVRYHSLQVLTQPTKVGDAGPVATAWAQDDGAIMGLADPARRQWGVQFHPESVLTDHGERLVANFFVEAGIDLGSRKGLGPGAVAVGDVPSGTTATVGPVAPVRMSVHRHPGPVDPWATYRALAELRRASGGDSSSDPVSVWLDSSDGGGISVFADATGPLAFTLEHRVGQGTMLSTGEELTGSLFDNLDVLLSRRLLAASGVDALPFDFRPGFLGYVGYEVKAETGGQAAHLASRPDAWLLFADRALVIDHERGTTYALALHTEKERPEQERWLDEMAALVLSSARQRETPPERPTLAASDDAVSVAGRHSPEEYRRLIQHAQQAIRSGETYEVCLTNEVSWPHRVEAASTYRAMREISPVPHAAWLECGGFSVLSASPERFVALSAQGQVRAEPIKGTRARDPDVERDRAVALELAADAKERAENLMIVDLLRNDLHRVCRAGSVEVPEMFAVRTWSTVHQLVSTITGHLAPGLHATDVLRSCFPGGSMTGAPKVRTMEILDALEGGPRGIYSGAIGWLGVNGAMDTSIVIRSVVLGPADSTGRAEAVFGVGGAITALSDPEEEYVETLIKARGVAAALGSP
ncbi:MAG: aminodeoxychorismate synthase component I [Ornithinimicrobium sp.]